MDNLDVVAHHCRQLPEDDDGAGGLRQSGVRRGSNGCQCVGTDADGHAGSETSVHGHRGDNITDPVTIRIDHNGLKADNSWE